MDLHSEPKKTHHIETKTRGRNRNYNITEPNQPAGLAGVEKPKKNSLQPKDIPPSNLPNKTSVVGTNRFQPSIKNLIFLVLCAYSGKK